MPRSTYRLQLGPQCTFAEAAAVVDYLAALGVSDVYLSPILAAPRGSAHGYHVTDPTRLNPELGGPAGFAQLATTLDRHGAGLLLDIVPNHLAASPDNPWWAHVLQHGRASPHATWFDIDWDGGDGRVLLPILGRELDEVLDAGEVVAALDERGPHLRYHDTRLPLDPGSVGELLAGCLAVLRAARGDHDTAVLELTRAVQLAERIPPRDIPQRREQRHALAEQLAARLWAVYGGPTARAAVDEALRGVAGPSLRELLDAQAYRLAHWRSGRRELNYRRFFDITDLVGLRVEDAAVFAARHDLLLRLVADGTVTGLRVDHVDGLREPHGYLQRLQQEASRAAGADSFYVVVEKILEGDEPLPPEWPVAGTTGYDFLTAANALWVDHDGLQRLGAAYTAFTGRPVAVADTLHRRKIDALTDLFPGEVDGLVRRLRRLAELVPDVPEIGEEALRGAVTAVTASFPVYRTYVRDEHLRPDDRAALQRAFADARTRHPEVDGRATVLLERVLMLDLPVGLGEAARDAWLDLVLRWQQLTGPAMAKGFEDTTFYIENRLTSLNEVGVDVHGIVAPHGAPGLHQRTARRAAAWPHTLNATSTHDTKRSEDVRARLQALSEVADAWATAVARWRERNEPHRSRVGQRTAPDRNEEWLLYQTLVGMWPLAAAKERSVRDRAKGFMEKAAREAKVNTSWLDQDRAYEAALLRFVDGVLDDRGFVEELRAMVDRVALGGAVNALAQVVLRVAAPGVPDTYQGTELWDWSLVDPDNRRPVDYALRRRLLHQIRADGDLVAVADRARAGWRDGRVKLLTLCRSLTARNADAELFLAGSYEPLAADGARAQHVVAFARRHGDRWAVAVVPRLTVTLVPGDWPLGDVWADTTVPLPHTHCRDALTGRSLRADDGRLRLADALQHLPVALLTGGGAAT
ncbi:MAG TPA: malto-oligosyltrehalose synthase [Nitriliruptorales bacterium]|nr:malto-oligosyltrehalose synthase [Nitriliruptorales bacterium]